MKVRKGFTLVELLVVIAILAILATASIIGFTAFTKRAQVSNDSDLVAQLNTYVLAASTDRDFKTVTEIRDELKKSGFELADLKLAAEKQDYYIGFDIKQDKFVLLKDGKGAEGYTVAEDDKVNVFVFVSTEAAAAEYGSDGLGHGYGYSLYLQNGEWSTLNVSKGVDVGENTGITSINYTNSTAQEVTIRTNSASTTLTIDDESEGTIYHYGSAGALNIIQCHTASYHENGNVGYAEIAYGRIVLESGSKVEEIHVNKKTDSSFDTVIIANNGGAEELPDRITRDAVTVAAETLVVKVESNGSSENVYVYADEATGTKGSTQKITEGENKQNENVNSALGQLVLDNGATADKAQTAEEKAEAKDEVASEAVSANFSSQEGNGDFVARIGQTGYMSLQSAVDAAVDGNTIVLLKDIVFGTTDYIMVNKDITLNLGGKSIAGSKDPFIVIGSTKAVENPSSSELTHTGHLTIRGEGSISNTTWCMFCVFTDAVLDIYGGNYYGKQCSFYVNGGTLNTYGGYFTSSSLYNPATTPYANYIVQVKNAGYANIIGGEFYTPEFGCYGVYLDNASVCNFGSTTGNGPTFNTWRPCIASNGSESHAVLANIYSGTYHSYRSDNATGENSVIQLANATSETQTLNVYGGTFEQTGSNENRCIFNVRYSGTINVNISGGTFVATSASRLFNGVGSAGSGWPSSENVHITVANNAISTPQHVKVYNTSDVYQSAEDFELTIE